jgi:hypothetical protein
VFLQLPGSFCHLNNFLNQEMSVHSCVWKIRFGGCEG